VAAGGFLQIPELPVDAAEGVQGVCFAVARAERAVQFQGLQAGFAGPLVLAEMPLVRGEIGEGGGLPGFIVGLTGQAQGKLGVPKRLLPLVLVLEQVAQVAVDATLGGAVTGLSTEGEAFGELGVGLVVVADAAVT
jgi:hypothetical protein